MKTKIFFLFILGAFLVMPQCRKPKQYKEFTDFPVTVEVTHQPIPLTNAIKYPSGFVFLDSALVVLDLHGDNFLSFFSLVDFSFMHHAIRRGRGPSEEESVFGIVNSPNKNEFWYKTQSGIKVVRYMQYSKQLILKEKFPNCDSFSGFSFLLGNDILGILRIPQNREFVKVFLDDCAVVDFGPNFPDVGKKLSIEEINNLLGAKSITTKPDGTLFAASYNHFPIIRVFDSSGNLVSDVRLKNHQIFPYALIENHATIKEFYNTTSNYFVPRSTNQFIYSSYSGKSLIELQPDIINEGFKITDFTNEIHVFDWEGNPVKRIILDEYIYSFGVSPDDKTLLAISMSEPEVLLKYDLSGNQQTKP